MKAGQIPYKNGSLLTTEKSLEDQIAVLIEKKKKTAADANEKIDNFTTIRSRKLSGLMHNELPAELRQLIYDFLHEELETDIQQGVAWRTLSRGSSLSKQGKPFRSAITPYGNINSLNTTIFREMVEHYYRKTCFLSDHSRYLKKFLTSDTWNVGFVPADAIRHIVLREEQPWVPIIEQIRQGRYLREVKSFLLLKPGAVIEIERSFRAVHNREQSAYLHDYFRERQDVHRFLTHLFPSAIEMVGQGLRVTLSLRVGVIRHVHSVWLMNPQSYSLTSHTFDSTGPGFSIEGILESIRAYRETHFEPQKPSRRA